MKCLRWAVVLTPFMLLGARCPPSTTPAQPRLTAVRLMGARVCGSFSSPGKQHTFTCDPLPTVSESGWQLTPLWRPLDASGHQKSNKIVVLTLTTPSLTDLQVDYEWSGAGAGVWTLRQKAPGPGQPLSVSARGEVEVDKTDDGTTRTWTVTANVSLCQPLVPLKFYNVGADGTRSGALSVVLLRAADEYATCGGGGGTFYASSGVPDPSPRPSTPPTGGPCPGGAPRREFGICENCTNPPDPKFNDWTGVEACDWEEVLQTFDYKNPDGTARFPKSQVCQAPRQQTRVDCEGPP